MNQRELYIQRTLKVAERLKQLGLEPPEMPQVDGPEFRKCEACQGSGRIPTNDKDEYHCNECGGSGQKVSDKLLEWNLEIARLAQSIRVLNG